MKFPGDKENNFPGIFDPKTPDLFDSVLADAVRSMLGMGYCNAVDPSTILSSQPTATKDYIPSPRDTIASIKATPPSDNIDEIKKLVVPLATSLLFPEQIQSEIQKFFQAGVTEFEEQHKSWQFKKRDTLDVSPDDPLNYYLESSPPKEKINNKDISPRAAIDSFSNSTAIDNFNPEPESLLDIFFNKDSPFNLLPDSFLSNENLKETSGLRYSNDQNNNFSTTTWSSVSVVTTADGVTKTRKTIRRTDGTEETTETVSTSMNNQSYPDKVDSFQLPSADPSRIHSITLPNQSPSMFNSFAKWWGQLLA